MFQVLSPDQSVINCNIELPFISGHAKSEDAVVRLSQHVYVFTKHLLHAVF